jgi:hypothetical protein
MHCANCGCWVEIPPHETIGFVARVDDAKYLILAEGRSNTRLVHECGLRGVAANPR